ncbi:peptidoglycan recognition family protein [Alkalinema pantanalense CENA528]|uniref:peptidoglycan recognition protein family protein n=1 Tax=Alkalinema pantanalense TaxID=1620705 RepID=UPI003D6EDE29
MKKQFWVALSIFAAGIIALFASIGNSDAEFIEGRPIPRSEQPSAISRIDRSLTSDAAVSPSTASDIPDKAKTLAGAKLSSEKLPSAKLTSKSAPRPNQPTSPVVAQSVSNDPRLSTDCTLRPDPKPRRPTRQELAPLRDSLPLTRFRPTANQTDPNAPQEVVALAHPTNFGQRYLQDIEGRPVQNPPIVVLHETDASGESTINFFQTPHVDDDDQVSYHALIPEDGRVIYMVPPDKRAFGAGNSVFVNNDRQKETVKTNPKFPPSVNNFAYHISLVTPRDGRGSRRRTHSGYSQAQYESLAWLIAKLGISADRITTHQLVDRSGERIDPRSFNVRYFLDRFSKYPLTTEISIQCTTPVNANSENESAT